MRSAYLGSLSPDARDDLQTSLHESQKGNCFICETPIDLRLHPVDVDHVEPLAVGGKDTPENFALTHQSCNRSKQASNLRVARVMARFDRLATDIERSPSLSDVLERYAGAKFELRVEDDDTDIKTVLAELGTNDVLQFSIYRDKLSGFRYVFMNLPIEYLHHDDRINPRPIGRNLKNLVEEFHKGLPQLHVALGWIEGRGTNKVRIFDGQHKAAAQILLGVRTLPVRVFINPDKDRLLTANTRAGTTLRQVAFDKSVQRSLGSALLTDRIERYIREKNLPDDYEGFSEQALCDYFKGEAREMRRYIIDWVRDSVTTHSENRLRDYIEYGGRKSDMPLSYVTIERTFYSLFVCQTMLDTPFNHRSDEGRNPRMLEIEQMVKLMNLVADIVFVGKFDTVRGTRRIEHDIQHDKDVPEDHLRACRMSREEIARTWLNCVRQLVHQYFLTNGTPIDESRLFQYPLPETCWNNIRNFINSLVAMPVWVNRDMSVTVFGAKHNYGFWQTIFETGSTPEGTKILPRPINLMEMIQS